MWLRGPMASGCLHSFCQTTTMTPWPLPSRCKFLNPTLLSTLPLHGHRLDCMIAKLPGIKSSRQLSSICLQYASTVCCPTKSGGHIIAHLHWQEML